MPARRDISSICVLGSGPIVIGQAAEFDYSGMQAIKALKADGYRVILVNSNPATIMTDPEMADATYIEPLTPDMVERVLEKEKPDALLPTVGGQTALNLAMELEKRGVLKRLDIELIGAKPEVIDRAENRALFKECMKEIGLESARSSICHTKDEAEKILNDMGLPLVIRPSFTMGGSGGGIARTREEFDTLVDSGIEQSPTSEILVEESLLGWKEYELELMRDKNDNVVVVCPIENLDPMGVHTGDSITVAPTMTLSDHEYQTLRDAGIAILRAIGVETGGSNVQFSINPKDGRLVVIEMNPRVSRSSALASKATGFPIAKVAAKLAVGYTLDEITNDITQKTKAAFEPSIDYVVVKAPRFNFEKFSGAGRVLTTQMKSVGEAMAIGRTFNEAFGKALRSLELGVYGVEPEAAEAAGGESILELSTEELLERAKVPSPDRIFTLVHALRKGASLEEVHESTAVDPWFLHQFKKILDTEAELEAKSLQELDAELFWKAKQNGLSDKRIATLTGALEKDVRATRKSKDVVPVMKRVDTCAGEFEAQTPYLYSTYEKPHHILRDGVLHSISACEARPTQKQKVAILGGGPIRIGQGIEFDYCCVHAAFAAKTCGKESIMVNCNPETVSTDYDTADRLYFEPVTLEDVLNIADIEGPEGFIVQFGGQTPLKLANALLENGQSLFGTSADAIDRAEDRNRSAKLVEKLDLMQPEGGTAVTKAEAKEIAEKLGYPVMLRPSYVLGGRAMETVYDSEELEHYLSHAVKASEEKPVLVDRFLDGAIEVDVDVVSDGNEVVVGGVMQHIEEAGIHSGDSACVLPPHTLLPSVVDEICESAKRLALELGVVGLMNVQFAVRKNRVFIIEVNPRASRTVPFVSKATGLSLARVATKAMLGQTLSKQGVKEPELLRRERTRFAIKEVVLPFVKFPGVDALLGPEMRSTGEVMGVHTSVEGAFAKSQMGAGTDLPTKGSVFFSVADTDKDALVKVAQTFERNGFELYASGGTHRFLDGAGVKVARVNKASEGAPHALELMQKGALEIIVNTSLGKRAISEGKSLRREAVTRKIPYFTTVAAAGAAANAIEFLLKGELDVRSIQSYLGGDA